MQRHTLLVREIRGFPFIDFSCNEFNIIVEAEDAGDEQESLGNIDQQTVRHVVDHDDLIRPSAMLLTMSSTAQAY